MRLLIALLTLAPTTLLAFQIGFTAINRFPVVQLGNATFEVIARGGRVNAQSYWCAAGDYGISVGLRSNARVYLVKPEGPSVSIEGRKAVQFTFEPEKAGVTPVTPQLSLSVKVPGDNMRLVSARQFCGSNALGF